MTASDKRRQNPSADGPPVSAIVFAEIDRASATVALPAAAARLTGMGEAPLTLGLADFAARFHEDDREALMAHLSEPPGGEDEREGSQLRLLLPGGGYRSLQVQGHVAAPLPDSDHESGRSLLAILDITRWKSGEARLRQAAERLEAAENVAGLGFVDFDAGDGRVFWSHGIYELLALDPSVPPDPAIFFERIHPDDRAAQSDQWEEVLSQGTALDTEYRVVRPDGSVRHVLARGRAVEQVGGRVTRYAGITLDVTESKRAQWALAESEARLALAQETVGIGVWDFNMSAGTSHWTKEIYDLLLIDPGTPADPELFFDRVHPDDIERLRSEFEAAIEARTDFESEFRIIRREGEVRHVAGRGRVVEEKDNQPERMIGVNYDITRQKAIELELRERTERQDFLVALGDALRGSPEPEDAMTVASRLLGEKLRVAYVGYGEIDARGEVRTGGEYSAGGEVPLFSGRAFDLHAFGPPLATPMMRGDLAIVEDIDMVDDCAEDARALTKSIGVKSYLCCPMLVDGKLSAYLFAAHDAPRQWSAMEMALLTATTERLHETVARARSEKASRQSDARFRTLFEKITAGFCVAEIRFDREDGRTDYRIVEANHAFFEQTGFPEAIIGQWLREAAPELEEHWYDIYGGVARTGEAARFEEHSEMLGRWFDVHAFRIDAPEDRRVAILFENVTERKKQETLTDTLLKEINHRSKNMLALIKAVAQQTHADDIVGFKQKFLKRVQSLAAGQDLLVSADWKGASIRELVRSQLGHFGGLVDERICLEGPDLVLKPEAAQTIGMALHELATNAGKYGSLSTDEGCVFIDWWLGEGPDGGIAFSMRWKEKDGPRVAVPERQGFGQMVVKTIVKANLSASVGLDYAPDGVAWSVTCPAEAVLMESGGKPAAGEAAGPATRAVGGAAGGILVVEDDALIALDVVSALESVGHVVLGPVRNVNDAFRELAEHPCSCAVLDISLDGSTSEPVAEWLVKQEIPFIVLSSYAKSQHPEVFRHGRYVPKPLCDNELLRHLAEVFPPEDERR